MAVATRGPAPAPFPPSVPPGGQEELSHENNHASCFRTSLSLGWVVGRLLLGVMALPGPLGRTAGKPVPRIIIHKHKREKRGDAQSLLLQVAPPASLPEGCWAGEVSQETHDLISLSLAPPSHLRSQS